MELTFNAAMCHKAEDGLNILVKPQSQQVEKRLQKTYKSAIIFALKSRSLW